MRDVFEGVGDMDEKIIDSIGTATSEVIDLTGGAIEKAGTGIGNIFHGFFGEIGGTIKWGIVLLLMIGFIYMKRESMKRAICRPKKTKDKTHTTSNIELESEKTKKKRLPTFWTDNPKIQLEDYYQHKRLFHPMRHVVHRLTANLEKHFQNYHKTLQVRYIHDDDQVILKHQEDYIEMLLVTANEAHLRVNRLYDKCILLSANKDIRKILKEHLFYQTPLKHRYSHFMTRQLNDQGETQGAPGGTAPRTALGELRRSYR